MPIAQTVSEISNLLASKRAEIADLTIDPDGSPELMLPEPMKVVGQGGRDNKLEVPIRTTSSGHVVFAQEAGALPAGRQGASLLAKVDTARKILATMDFTTEKLVAMADAGRFSTTMTEELACLAARLKARKIDYLMGMGSGGMARVNAQCAQTTKITFSGPMLVSDGDWIDFYTDHNTSTLVDDTGPFQVVKADPVSRQLIVHKNTKNTDHTNALIVFADTPSQASVQWQHPQGILAGLDDANASTNFLWDPYSSTNYPHVTSYGEISRTSAAAAKLNVTWKAASAIDGSTSVTQRKLNFAVAAAMAFGARADDLIMLMHPDMHARAMALYTGQAPRSESIRLAGGDAQLPTMTVAGFQSIPVISSYKFSDGFIAVLNRKDWIMAWREPEWVTIAGSRELPIVDTTTGRLLDGVSFTLRMWLNFFCRAPFRQVVINGLSTS